MEPNQQNPGAEDRGRSTPPRASWTTLYVIERTADRAGQASLLALGAAVAFLLSLYLVRDVPAAQARLMWAWLVAGVLAGMAWMVEMVLSVWYRSAHEQLMRAGIREPEATPPAEAQA